MSPVKPNEFSTQTPIDQDSFTRSIDSLSLQTNSSFGQTTDSLLNQLEGFGDTLSGVSDVFSKHSEAVSPFADFVEVGNTMQKADNWFKEFSPIPLQPSGSFLGKGLALAKKPLGAIGGLLNGTTGVVDVFKALAEDKKSGDHLQTKTAGAIVKATTKTMATGGIATALGVGAGLVFGSGIIATAATAGVVIGAGYLAGKAIDSATDKAFDLWNDFRAGLR